MSPATICLQLDPRRSERCQQLAARLDIDVLQSADASDSQYILAFDQSGRLTLKDRQRPGSRPFHVVLSPRRQAKGRDPLLRALGSSTHSIIDCTAGLGTDAAHIAAHAGSVLAIERNPVMYSLLEDALLHCQHDRILEQLTLRHDHSSHWLQQLSAPVDVIYMDPMYPPRPGSAAVKKPVQLLQQLATLDSAGDRTLLELARCHVRHRVVVKRPHYAAPLLPGNSGETRGKLVRFDIYPPTR